MPSPGPPLDPSGDEGRSLLRRELLHREYHTHNPVERVLDWLDRLFTGAVGAASGVSWLATALALLIAVLLVVGLILLLTRLRGDRRQRAPSAPVLPADRPSASELRRRAEASRAEGRHDDAVVDGFRALAARQIERGRLPDQPGATAHEVAERLVTTYPGHGSQVSRTADLFDATLYGDQPASRADADAVLALDETLAGSR